MILCFYFTQTVLILVNSRMPFVLKGRYDLASLGQLILASIALSVVSAGVGMGYFARRDV